MKQLPGVDVSFRHLETPQMPMHVGVLHKVELPASHGHATASEKCGGEGGHRATRGSCHESDNRG